MRPSTLHAVFTPKSAICLGGHFYSIGTITRTVYSIIHTFVGSQTLTNTEHAADSRTLLCRLLIHIYEESVASGFSATPEQPIPVGNHLPAFNTWEGVVEIVNLVNVIELEEVLHWQTYTRNGLSYKEQQAMKHCHKLGRELLHWLWCNYSFSIFAQHCWEHVEPNRKLNI
ncbi:hypothetical protein L208DRAFT_1253710 [Tricholoma matsutake]|nr:hypothetical protein L208DRAFT_1253710 [Tricholoma matsutake 945]